MFLYFSKNAKINNLVDIFISSTSVIFGIFQAVVITGYTLLGPFWFEPVTCEICPKLIIYFHFIGIVSVGYVFITSMLLLSSHKVTESKQTECAKSSAEELQNVPDGVVQNVAINRNNRHGSISSGSISSMELLNNDSPTFNIPAHAFKKSKLILEEIESTEWAHWVENTAIHSIYSIFFIMHFLNLIFGTMVVFPLFFELYNMDWMNDGGFLVNERLCNVKLFWFTFLSLVVDYFMTFVAVIGFFRIAVPLEMSDGNTASFNYVSFPILNNGS